MNNGVGGKRIGAGRPMAQLDLVELEKLCAMMCTETEIADWFRVSRDTIAVAKKRPEYAAVMERGRSLGCISLRRKQMQMAEAGNVGMLIWLGKQYLGQRDNLDMQHTGPDGGPVQIAVLYKDADGTHTNANDETEQ